MAVTYEWVIETLDGPDAHGAEPEILDVDHADTYAEAVDRAKQYPHARIGLVRDSDRDGRAWAYCRDGLMSARMEDAFGHFVCPVPTRYALQFGGVRTPDHSRRR